MPVGGWNLAGWKRRHRREDVNAVAVGDELRGECSGSFASCTRLGRKELRQQKNPHNGHFARTTQGNPGPKERTALGIRSLRRYGRRGYTGSGVDTLHYVR